MKFRDLGKSAANENIPLPPPRPSIKELREMPNQVLGNLRADIAILRDLQNALGEHIDELQNKGPSVELDRCRLMVKDVREVAVDAHKALNKFETGIAANVDEAVDVLENVRDWEEQLVKIVGPHYKPRPKKNAETVLFPYDKLADA